MTPIKQELDELLEDFNAIYLENKSIQVPPVEYLSMLTAPSVPSSVDPTAIEEEDDINAEVVTGAVQELEFRTKVVAAEVTYAVDLQDINHF